MSTISSVGSTATEAKTKDVFCDFCSDNSVPTFPICHEAHSACDNCISSVVGTLDAEVPKSGNVDAGFKCVRECEDGVDIALVAIAIATTERASATGADSPESVMAHLLVKTSKAARAAREAQVCQVGIEERRKQSIDKAIATVEAIQTIKNIQDALTETCPNCKVALDDRDRWNHMTCKECNTSFCVFCRAIEGPCTSRCSKEGIPDKESANRVRNEQKARLVRLELETANERLRNRVVDKIADLLQEMTMAEAPGISAGNGTLSARAMGQKVSRMQDEMTALSDFMSSGGGYLQELQEGYESIQVDRSVEGDRDLVISCTNFPGEASSELETRESELSRATSTAFFAKARGDRSVHLFRRHEDTPLRVSAPTAIQDQTEIQFYMDFGREQRAIDTLAHLQKSEGESLSPALRALLGAEENTRILHNQAAIVSDAEKARKKYGRSAMALNKYQLGALDARSARLVLPVVGPPGTGKTTVITNLLRAPVCDGLWILGACNRHVVIVCSEKNLAVDAVAASLLKAGGNKPESHIWRETICHGVKTSVGSHASRFILEEKVVDAKEVSAAISALAKAKLACNQKLSALITSIQTNFPKLASEIPGKVIPTESGLESGRKDRPKITILQVLVRNWTSTWTPDYVCRVSLDCAKGFMHHASVKMACLALENSLANYKEASQQMDRKEQKVHKAKSVANERLLMEARVILVTLGSSHGVMKNLTEMDASNSFSASVICDESSTVHTALFLQAMVALNVKITNLIAVGDDRQLDPYWPVRSVSNSSHQKVVQPVSLFQDAMNVARSSAIYLKVQYRMGRSLMDILNEFFYQRDPLICGKSEASIVPSPNSLKWIHVRTNTETESRIQGSGGRAELRKRRDTRGETSECESKEIVHIVRDAQELGKTVLVLTPYRRQRELLKENLGIHHDKSNQKLRLQEESNIEDDVRVCTVDGAQGQEADIAVISLVRQYPSRFLNDKRLCVMLSRAKEAMILVGDRESHRKCRALPLQKLARVCVDKPAISHDY